MTLSNILEDYEKDSYGTIDESGAGLSRVLKFLEDGQDFLIITASRGGNSRKKNAQRNNDLIKGIRSDVGTKSGAYKLVGHWKECSEPLEDGQKISDCKGTIKDTLEDSWLIPKPKGISSEEFFDVAKKYAVKYDQDGFVIRLDGKLTLNGKDGSEWANLGKANNKSLSNGFSRIVDVQGFSELKKNRGKGKTANIVFESLTIVVPKDSNISKQIFQTANILY